jgi:DivIVA domain-containing protein
MIDLTPLEVRKKKGDFRRVLRGYDRELVDDFLDLVADRLEELVRENMALTERWQALEERVTDYREREKALTEALVSAQEFKEARLNQVSREADLRLREAQSDAERIRDDALREREREDEGLRRVRARRTQLIESFRAFLQREMHQLDVESAALDLQDVTSEAAARVWELGEETRRPPPHVIPPAPPPPRTVARSPAISAAAPARATPPSAQPPVSPAPFTAFSTQITPSAQAERVEPPDDEPVPQALAPDGLPPITGDEEWLPRLDDER